METRSQNPNCPGGRKEDRKKNHHSIVLHLNSTFTLVGMLLKAQQRILTRKANYKKKKKRSQFAQLTGLDSLAGKEALLDTKPRSIICIFGPSSSLTNLAIVFTM